MENSLKPPNYVKAYSLWVALCCLALAVVPPILDANSAGGEAEGLTFSAVLIEYALYGLIALSIIFLCKHKSWNKKYVITNSLILIFSSYQIANYFYRKHVQAEGYDTSSDLTILDKDTIEVRKEFYMSTNLKKLRSVKYWRNHQPDGTWLTYDVKGNVINTIKHP